MLSAEFHEEQDAVFYAEICRGDVTVHNERVMHGSGPNQSNGWRRAYVLAFRSLQELVSWLIFVGLTLFCIAGKHRV